MRIYFSIVLRCFANKEHGGKFSRKICPKDGSDSGLRNTPLFAQREKKIKRLSLPLHS